MTRRPIFVTGSSRSGTTMVARMLDRHPDVHTLRELHFVEELWDPSDDGPIGEAAQRDLAQRLLHRARVSYNLPFEATAQAGAADAVLAARPATSRPAVDVLWAVLEHETVTAGASRPCEQTPRNVFYLRELLREFPEARALALVRDPRDVVLSMKNWWRRGQLGAREQTWRTTLRRRIDYHPIVSALLWRSTIRAIDALADEPRVMVVSFEGLVRDPRGTLAAICAHLDLEPRDEMLEVARQNSSNALDRTDPRTGVDPAAIGRGVTELSATERWIVERLAHREMAEFGYGTVGGRPTALGVVAVTLSLVPKAVLAVIANVRRARSPLRALGRRLRR